MMQGWSNTLFSALIGGAVGAAVVLFTGSSQKKLDTLTVKDLTIVNKAVLLSKEGKEDVVLREGSVLANNIILGKKFIGTQYQGQVFVGNRIFTSPDDLAAVPMEQWKFYTEIGSNKALGGEFIVHSANGGNAVNQPDNNGMTLRTGFDKASRPAIAVIDNKEKAVAAVAQLVSTKPTATNLANTTANPASGAFDAVPAKTEPAVASPHEPAKPLR